MMGKPTELEMKRALAAAERLRGQGDDPDALAKALRYLNDRVKQLEQVLHAAESYLHSGHAVMEHARLMRAIDEARRADLRAAGEDENFPLLG